MWGRRRDRQRRDDHDRQLVELADLVARTGDGPALVELWSGFGEVDDYRDPRWFQVRLKGSVGLKRLYDRTGDPDHLTKAVESCRDLFGDVPFDDPEWASYATILGRLLQQQSIDQDDLEALRLCLEVHRLVADVTPPEEPKAFARYTDLALSSMVLFQRTGEENAIDEAVDVAWIASGLSDASDPREQVDGLRNLAVALERRWRHRGGLEDHRDSIEAMALAANATPADDPRWEKHFREAGGAFYGWFSQGGSAEEVDGAFQVYRDVAHNHGERVDDLERLAATKSDPGEDVERLRDALTILPTDDPRRETYLERLFAVHARPPR